MPPIITNSALIETDIATSDTATEYIDYYKLLRSGYMCTDSAVVTITGTASLEACAIAVKAAYTALV